MTADEARVLTALDALARRGTLPCTGREVALEAWGRDGARYPVAGSVYRALERLADDGVLARRLERRDLAASEGRPPRVFYLRARTVVVD